MHLIFIVFIKEECIYENIKERFCLFNSIRIICFLYGGTFRGGIFRIPFPICPKMTENCKNETFLKLCGIQENLVPFKNANLYLLESERLAKCCFDKNLIDGPTIEKINMKPMR